MKMRSPFQPKIGEVMTLPPLLSWPEATAHVFDQDSVDAVQMALAAHRPLLVRGEPGVGKSQLARAAAHQLHRPLLCEVVHARCECEDLLYRFDAVARLAEAQVLGAGEGDTDVREALRETRFLRPGLLWWAFDWPSALEQATECRAGCDTPAAPAGWQPEHGVVVLIDEIDKAETEVPNALLEALGNGGFHVPYTRRQVRLHPEWAVPLVVVTTNEERELPAAFVRRCLVLHMRLAAEGETETDALIRRGQAHFGRKENANEVCIADEVCREAAEQLVRDRAAARQQGLPLPGHAEYLDILKALKELCPDNTSEQIEALRRIAKYACRKQTFEEEA